LHPFLHPLHFGKLCFSPFSSFVASSRARRGAFVLESSGDWDGSPSEPEATDALHPAEIGLALSRVQDPFDFQADRRSAPHPQSAEAPPVFLCGFSPG
jgi:hypothetical protein